MSKSKEQLEVYVNSVDVAAEETEDFGKVKVVRVRTGRHVDHIQFIFEDGRTREYGNADGGEECSPFELDTKAREYIVRIKGRQNKHLDGIQFVTNLGRESRWYGGGGGQLFQKRATAGTMVVGFEAEDTTFCPRIFNVLTRPAIPSPSRPSLLRLLLHRNVRKLVFGGHPSLFENSRKGKPSVLRLLFKKRMIMIRVMFRSDPCFLRLVLQGEELSAPSSLFRTLCTPASEGTLSAMQMMNCRDKSDKTSKSINQLILMGSPSVARQFFGKGSSQLKPLVQLLFDKDTINGYPSISQLLTVRDELDGIQHPSVFEAALEGEQFLGVKDSRVKRVLSLGLQGQQEEEEDEYIDTEDEGEGDEESIFKETQGVNESMYPISLMRLLLMGEPSLLSLFLEGERDGKPSILRRFLESRNEQGHSLARMCMTNYEDHTGHRPALSTYIFGGENLGRPSLLRMLIAGEARQDQHSLMRLLLYRHKSNKPSLFRAASSFRKKKTSDINSGGNGLPQARRSLIDLLTSGNPSIADLFFQGELEGDDSLARLMLGTCVDFKGGVLRLGGTLKAGNENGVSLMQWMLVGEEDGGPGISFIRLLLFGEEDNGFSLLRLLLVNENTNEPSMLRILLTTLKAILIASKTRPHQIRNGEWKTTARKIADSIVSSQNEGVSFRSQFEKFAESLNPSSDQFQLFLSVLKTIPKRGKEFQSQWKRQWLRVSEEIENAGKRAKKGTIWRRMAPKWKNLAHHMAMQDWAQLAADLAALASSMDALSKWTERIKRVHAATPSWILPKSLSFAASSSDS